MSSKLIEKVAQRLTECYSRLVLAENADRFLAQEEVCGQLLEQHGWTVVKGSQIELRVHYELVFKADDEHKYVYLTDCVKTLLPDMSNDGAVLNFKIADMFPFFTDKQLLRKQPMEVLERLYEGYATKRVAVAQCAQTVEGIKSELEKEKTTPADDFPKQWRELDINWRKTEETIKSMSAIISKAIGVDRLNELDEEIHSANDSFQQWVDEAYFPMQHSSHLNAPKCVNKILPFLTMAHQRDERVALYVVDGFSYWQYCLLRGCLQEKEYNVQDSATLSWLPSITKLSRQAIFRGDDPKLEYVQSPANERKLWTEYWKKQHFNSFEIQYISDSDADLIKSDVKRLAVVTTEMDEKMHSSTNYKELWLLTDYWCVGAMKAIDEILDDDFTLYLTADHGSVLSKGWRTLSKSEKVYLYADGSRGTRHLIYEDKFESARAEFERNNAELNLLSRDNWLCMRDDLCLGTRNKKEITHGGSHFMEMVIPFVKISRR